MKEAWIFLKKRIGIVSIFFMQMIDIQAAKRGLIRVVPGVLRILFAISRRRAAPQVGSHAPV